MKITNSVAIWIVFGAGLLGALIIFRDKIGICVPGMSQAQLEKVD